ncbi:MAG: cytochrome c biogenesis protein CcsA [Candidatus Paracaedibacteraceae bacterium]|nr:cytochrome c biogenesis protein CcsA [Candidatus Paracaedibacteraceae bacterium]
MQLSWTPYVGQALLYLAAIIASLVCLLPRYKVGLFAFLWLTIAAAFGWLMCAHITSDFSFLNVVMHSHTQKPLLYKISGVWGNHEGSMLLWLLLLVTVGGTAFRSQAQGLSFVAYSTLAVLLFLIVACNPFTAVLISPLEGRDLNPLLQDPLLAIHPPFLYLGIVSSLIPLILSSLRQWDRSWAYWTLFSWTFLTIGIVLGSFWAYYELGWGGWWFWDPVENAALIPWLLQTAAIHSLILVRQGRLSLSVPKWLSFATFATCLLGTFIIRSGLVTSVHSFAVDPERGIFLLLVALVILLPLAVRLWKIKTVAAGLTPVGLNLAMALKLGVFFLCFTAFTVAFGTLYPLILQAFNSQLTVGAPYFNATVIPIMIPLLVLMALQPWLTSTHLKTQQALSPLLIAAAAVVLLWFQFHMNRPLILGGYGVGVWLLSSMILGVWKRRWTRLQIPMILAHSGVGLAVVGMALTLGFEDEKLVALRTHDTVTFHNQNLTLTDIIGKKGENYMGQTAHLRLNNQTTLKPQKRFYWTQGIIHQETAIYSQGFDHYYISMGDHYQDDSWGFRLAYKPWINLMWLGFCCLGLAGLWRLGQRRRRA